MSRRRRFLFSGGAGEGFASPTAPTINVTPGVTDGGIVIDVQALPASWGDDVVPGDAGGDPGTLEWWNVVDGWQLLDSSPSTGTTNKTVNEALWDTTADIRVRGVSAQGRSGAMAFDTVLVPGNLSILDNVVSDGVQVQSDGVDVVTFVDV